MTDRPCSGCGLNRCEGECYDDQPDDALCLGCKLPLSGGGYCLACTHARSKLGQPLDELKRTGTGGYWS